MNGEDIERAGDACDVSMGSLLQIDFLLVCNTDPSHRLGEHWVAIYVDDEGRYGEYSVTFRRYLDKHCVYWSYNDVQLQSVVSRFRGHYCVRYCILRSRGIDMRSSFTRDTGFNDVLVHGFVCVQ